MELKQNQFSRTLLNESKLGAYYTDVNHCKRIGRLFKFPEETCILEPSVGNGEALLSFLSAAKPDKAYTYGVELNGNTFSEVNPKLSYCLHADFLTGVAISPRVFSFCFSNPPYGEISESHERLESKFVERIYTYMKTGGYLVLIVSLPTMKISSFVKNLIRRFGIEAIYRFDDDVFSKFKQVAVIAKRKHVQGYYDEEVKNLSQMLERLPYLPDLLDEPDMVFEVPGSANSDIQLFAPIVFDAADAVSYMADSSLYKKAENIATQMEFHASTLGRPPLPLKKDLLYLCAVAGAGQGKAGGEDHDLHLQRGVAKVVKKTVEITDDDGKVIGLTETTSTKISMWIVENDGVITKIE